MDDGGGIHPVCPVLFGAVVTQGDFMLIVQPILIIGFVAEIQYPLAESLPHRTEVTGVRFSVFGEVVEQVVMAADETVPEIEYIIDLVSQNLSGQLEVLFILICKKDRFFSAAPVPPA